ncbi:PAS domain S-box protein [Mariprofundus erugo]|nr:PAS domain S-box protein [Mariprofundus erugo]
MLPALTMNDKPQISHPVHTLYLVLIMATVAMIVLSTAIAVLYRVAFQEEQKRLIDTAQSRARLIEAVARFDLQHSGPDAAFEATLSQIREAHQNFPGFGETGEFTLAQRQGDNIVFLISHRHHDLSHPHPVPMYGHEAAPMRQALQGKSGSIVGPDYRGEQVLAAFEPVAELNLGVVAKIDMREIRAPFIRAGQEIAITGLLLVLLGAWAFRRITIPMAHSLEESEELFRNTFAHAGIGLAHVSVDGAWLRVNPALCDMLGYTHEALLQLAFQDLAHPEDIEADLQLLRSTLAGERDSYSIQKRYIRKDSSVLTANLTVSLVRRADGSADYFISAIADIGALKEAESALRESNTALSKKNQALHEAMKTIKTISGVVPLCAWCGKTIRDDHGEWVKIETYLEEHTDANISHGMCPECKGAFTAGRGGSHGHASG